MATTMQLTLNPVAWPWGRIAYSALLLLIAAVTLREVWRVWTDHALYIGAFRYIKNGVEQSASGAAFAAEVLHYHQLIAQKLQEEYERRQKHVTSLRSIEQATPPKSEIGHLPLDVAPIASPRSALSDVELKVQGFDVGQLLARLRKEVRPQNEVSGHVDDIGGSITVSIHWSGGPSEAKGESVTADHFAVAGFSDSSAAAFRVACRLIHAQAAIDKRSQYLATVPAEEFCEWTWWWRKYRNLVDRSQREAFTDEDDKSLAEIRAGVTHLIKPTTRYAELWRLRANILAITRKRTKEDDAQLAEDWRTYASLLAQSPPGPVGTISSKAARVTAERVTAASVTPELPIIGRWVWTSLYSAVTVTAIVKDASGKEFLLLPDYAGSASTDASLVIRSAPQGGVVLGRNGWRIPLPGTTGDFGGVFLVPVEPGIQISAMLPDGASIKGLARPNIGEGLILWGGKQGRTAVRVSTLSATFNHIPNLIGTESKVTQQGDGGAPVLNAHGELVAMGYMGDERVSYLLPLKNLLEQSALTIK